MKLNLLTAAVISVALASAPLHAFEIGKPITTSAIITTANNALTASPMKKDVVLMNIKLTEKEKQAIFNYNPRKKHASLEAHNYSSKVNLGMNGVPVLDQGLHGTCVTFATTAAIDAILGKGDYVSPLCSLELGNYLENKGYLPSGWDGSFGPWVLEQMTRFGIVSKRNQTIKSCARITEYPTNNENNKGNIMAPEEYRRMSEDISEKLYAIYHLNAFERMDAHYSDTNQGEQVLAKVKQSLSNGHRLTFGVLLILPEENCYAGACATHNAKFDTWALTKDIETPSLETGGHEMIITGYDDNATAYDKEGIKHKGLLTLRNSWGSDVGDKGNFYMSYDYFMKFTDELQEIVAVSK